MHERRRSVAAQLAICMLLGCMVVALQGCSGALTPSQRVDKELSSVKKSKLAVFPFAGKVLVDGLPFEPKSPDERVVVVLFNRAQPELRLTHRPYAVCNRKGDFSFTTYVPNDGVEPAEYLVAISQLSMGKGDNLSGPDGFQNLYNDPDANEKEPEFTVKHASPGKSDYVFELKLAGREPISAPGPRAVTRLVFGKGE
jgi:hypothetical protein